MSHHSPLNHSCRDIIHCTTQSLTWNVTPSTTQSLMQGHHALHHSRGMSHRPQLNHSCRDIMHCTTQSLTWNVTPSTTESLMQGHHALHHSRGMSHHPPLNHSCRDIMHCTTHMESHHSVGSLGSLTPDSCFVSAESRVTITIRTSIHFQWELNKPQHRLGVNAVDSKWRHGGGSAAQV